MTNNVKEGTYIKPKLTFSQIKDKYGITYEGGYSDNWATFSFPNSEYYIEVDFDDVSPITEYNSGSWEGSDTMYGGGWYEEPGNVCVGAEFQSDLRYMYDGDEVSKEDFMYSTNIGEQDLKIIEPIIFNYANNSFEEWVIDNYEE